MKNLVDSDRVKMINQRIARDTLNSAYGIVSRDWADVLADSARYIYAKQSRCSGKTLWFSSAAEWAGPMRDLREEYPKGIGCEEDEKLSSWLKTTPITPMHYRGKTWTHPESLYGKNGKNEPEDHGKLFVWRGLGIGWQKLPDDNGYLDTYTVPYCLNDVAVTEKIFKEEKIMRFDSCKPTIKNVIFNDPATIVFWSDGSKTVVKCGEDEDFDPEKGIAMCCMKKLLGTNKTGSNYLDKTKKYISKWEEDNPEENIWTKLFCEFVKMTGEDLVNTGAMDIPEEIENPGLTDEALKEVAEGGENNE